MAAPLLTVRDAGRELSFAFDDLLRYHGPRSPGGVAHAFKVLERALPLLVPAGEMPDRREIAIRTAFGGPGARDGFELVTRAVTDDRYVVDDALRRPQLGEARERFVFAIGHGERAVGLALREGYVTDEFAALAFGGPLTPEQDDRLTVLKAELADRLMAAPADAVYDVDAP